MVNQIKPKHRNWTPGVTGTIGQVKYNRNVMDPYDHEPLHRSNGTGRAARALTFQQDRFGRRNISVDAAILVGKALEILLNMLTNLCARETRKWAFIMNGVVQIFRV